MACRHDDLPQPIHIHVPLLFVVGLATYIYLERYHLKRRICIWYLCIFDTYIHTTGAYSMGINIAIVTLFWRSCSTHICRPCRPVCNSCRPIADQLQTGLQTIADHLQPSKSNLSGRSATSVKLSISDKLSLPLSFYESGTAAGRHTKLGTSGRKTRRGGRLYRK